MNSIIDESNDKRKVDLYHLEKMPRKIDNKNIISYIYKNQSEKKDNQTVNENITIIKTSKRRKEKISQELSLKNNNNILDDKTNDNIGAYKKSNTFSNKNILKRKIIFNNIKLKYIFSNNKINYFIKMFLIFFISSGQRTIYSNNTNITIKIRGSGMQNIFYGGNSCEGGTIFTKPNEVYINDIKQTNVSDKYNLSKNENNVTLLWKNTNNNCKCLFKDCKNITNIDFTQFDFSQGLIANGMFYNCESLTSLNLHDYSGKIKVEGISNIFTNCFSLTSLNLSNLDVSAIKDISGLFNGCKSLISLDLSNFAISVQRGEKMFYNCPNLIYVNLINTHFCSPNVNINNFLSEPKNIVFCSGCGPIHTIINNYSCAVIDCTENWKLSQKKINLENNQCVNNCSLTQNNKFNYNSMCYVSCPNGTYDNNFNCEDCHPDCKTCDQASQADNTNCRSCLSSNKFLHLGNCIDNCIKGYYVDENDSTNKICKCDLDKCYKCSKESFTQNLCISCNDGYYPKYSDNKTSFIDCYKSINGYYLDIANKESFFKPCYKSCEICNISGNETHHNCIKCKSDFFSMDLQYYKNCYNNCSYLSYFDFESNTSYCTPDFSCPEKYNKLIPDKKECIDNCEKDVDYKYEFRKTCYKECPEGSNISSLNNSFYCEASCPEEMPFVITSTQECVKYCSFNDIKENLCILNFQKEEDKEEITNEKEKEIKLMDLMLKNIGDNFLSGDYDTSKLDKGEDDVYELGKMTITFTTPENQKNNTNKNVTIIDLGYCETLLRDENHMQDNETLYIKKIDIIQDGIKIPKIEYEVYRKVFGNNFVKLNLSICGDNKVSITVPVEISEKENMDKLNTSSEYFNNICYKASSNTGTDMSLKDRQKEFVEGNKTLCQEDCDFSDYNHSFKVANCSCKIKESPSSVADMNINKDKLYTTFDNKKSSSNLGITSCNVLSSKENIISNVGFFLLLAILAIFIVVFIIFCSTGYNSLEEKMNEIIQKKFKLEPKIQKNKIIKPITKQNKEINKKRKNIKDKENKPKLPTSKEINSNNLILRKTQTIKRYSRGLSTILTKNNNNKKLSKKPVFKPGTDYEKNWLPYEKALIYDRRTGCEYYFSLIKSKQLIMFTFCSFNDFNSEVVKKFMIFLSFALHYTTNALFFTESNMHQIYEDEGKFNFSYQVKFIIYSAAISTFVLRLILQFLVLIDKDILSVKQQETKEMAIRIKREKLKYMKIKFAIFFILNFILLVLFWYYLTCFNAIYQNTKTYLIKNTFISFGFSLFYPFIINIFPTIIRMCSIHSSKKDNNYLYNFSKVFQLI